MDKLLLVFLVLTTGVSTQRNNQVVEITERNIERLTELISEADPGTEFVFLSDVELPSLISIPTNRITLRGGNLTVDRPPIIRCGPGNEDGVFFVSSNRVEFANLIIQDCRRVPISVSTIIESDDPFAAQDNLEPVPVTAFFRNVIFRGNSALTGSEAAGAIYLSRRANAEIEDCRFEGNSAPMGGAIRFLGTSLQITNSVFYNNTGTNSGGAIHGSATTPKRRNRRQKRSLIISKTQFIQNRVLIGGEDPRQLTITSGVPLEANQYLKFPLPSPSGGAISVVDFSSITITDSSFEGNSAVPAGGAIHLLDNGEIELDNCTFKDNFLQPVTRGGSNREDLQVGGAMFVAFTDPLSKLEIKDSEFMNNSAVYGGALHVVAPVASHIALFENSFRRNVARLGGGAMVFRNIDSPEITMCDFVQNSAFVGGAIFITNGGGLKSLEGYNNRLSNFRKNVAFDGGAIFGLGSGTVQIFSTAFTENQAQRHGGAVCFIDSKAGGEFGLQDSRMHNNTAEKGGAVFLDNVDSIRVTIGPVDRAEVALFGESRAVKRNEFFSNEAVAGGAIFYRASNLVSNSFIGTQCRFVNNQAHSNLSMIYNKGPLSHPRGTSDLTRAFSNRRLHQSSSPNENSMYRRLLDPISTEPCNPGGGGAVCFVLSGIPQRVPVSIILTQSHFENNSAFVAGGLFLSTDANIEWESRCPPVDESTSTLLTSDPCRSLRLRNLTFVNNSAQLAGGGIFASNLTHVQYSSDPMNLDREQYQPLSEAFNRDEFGPNFVSKGGYGPNIASMATRLGIREPWVQPKTGLLISNQSSGQANHLPVIFLEVLDRMDQVISAGIADSQLKVHVSAVLPGNDSSSIASGQIDAVAEAGIANFSALALLAPAGVYRIEFLPPRESIESTSGQVELRPCLMGEINNTEGYLCDFCLFESFAFDTNRDQCVPCPSHARCNGGASLVPMPNEACSYERRTDRLERQHHLLRFAFFNRFKKNAIPNFHNTEYSQCADGYMGPLCGACEDGYGRTDGKTCGKCGSKSGTVAVVFLLSIWQLLLLSVTIRSALVSIRDMNQMMTIIGQNSTTGVSGQDQRTVSERTRDSRIRLAPEQMDEAFAYRQETLGGESSSRALPVLSKQRMSIDYIIAAQHVSETIKIFVNFLQITSVAVNINVEWTTTIKNMLATMNSIAGFSNGATFTPMTCMLDENSDNRSIYGVILRIAFPLLLMLLVMIFFALQWFVMMKTPNNYTRAYCSAFLKSRVVICFLVVIFFSYQSISEDLMGTVSCIELDSEEINDKTIYPMYSIAGDRYWTEDTTIQCFERKHAFLAGFLGIPGIVFFIIGVPVYLLFFLLYSRSKNQLLELNVLNTYGFIYQNYEERFVYWEVCILVRKALIGAIIVFAYPLGANLQGVMALGVLILALAIHLIAAPFKYLLLNILEGCSLLVSIFTFYSGVVFNDENTTQAANILLSTLLVLINLSLITVFLVCVFKYGDKYVVAKLKFLGIQDVPANFFPRVIKLASVVASQAATSLANTLRQTLRGSQDSTQRTRSPRQFQLDNAQKSTSEFPEAHGGNEIDVEVQDGVKDEIIEHDD
eukprot:g5780.t1